jgi:hypothetical protein
MFLHAMPLHRDGRYCHRLLVQLALPVQVLHQMPEQLIQLTVLMQRCVDQYKALPLLP